MSKNKSTSTITVKTAVAAPVTKVWECWTSPKHITKWNHASDDWHTTHAENDLRPGGRFVSRMEAKDGSAGFDFGGVYDYVRKHEYIAYTMDDGRKVSIRFTDDGNTTRISETFDPEQMNSRKMQKDGWQAIINNFKKYVEKA